jgi:beta-glucanase (GH16 family)
MDLIQYPAEGMNRLDFLKYLVAGAVSLNVLGGNALVARSASTQLDGEGLPADSDSQENPAVLSANDPEAPKPAGGGDAPADTPPSQQSPDQPATPERPAGSWTIDFASQPNGKPNAGHWNFQAGTGGDDPDCLCDGWGNAEDQYYTGRRENVRIENGKLVIEARGERMGDKLYTSARINTKGKLDFMYGELEVTAKLPKGRGTWPAIWMLSSDEKYTASAPDSAWNDPNFWAINGEIDVMEAVGHDPGLIFNSLHTYASVSGPFAETPGVPVSDMYGSFHRYGLRWTADSLTYTLDGNAIRTVRKTSNDPKHWPFSGQKFHLILNVAVGGEWGGQQGIDPGAFPARMEIKKIDYTAPAR